MADMVTAITAACKKFITIRYFVVALLSFLALLFSHLSRQRFPDIFWSVTFESWDHSPLLFICAFVIYFATPISIGFLIERMSAKWIILGITTVHFITEFLDVRLHHSSPEARILSPITSETSRATIYPMLNVIICNWSPPKERSFMISVIAAGLLLGTGISETHQRSGSLLYCPLKLSITWCIVWCLLVRTSLDQPQCFITEAEENYIKNSLGSNQRAQIKGRIPFPWRKIFTSKAFMSLFLVHICVSHVNRMPRVMQWCLKLSSDKPLWKMMAERSLLTHSLAAIFAISFGGIISILLQKNIIRVTPARKFATFISLFPPLLCTIISVCWKQPSVVLILNTILLILSSAKYSGTMANIIDIAPNFSGPLVAIFVTIDLLCAVLQLIIATPMCRTLTEENDGLIAIASTVLVSMGLSVLAFAFYYRYGSAEEQPWSKKVTSDVILNRNTTASAESPDITEDDSTL